MKIVVQLPPDSAELAELALEGWDKDNFVVDQDTYCYFRDEVFIKGIEKYIRKKYPGKFKDTKNYDAAEAVSRWYDNQDRIVKYYPQYNKIRDRFYLYKEEIYAYVFLGFWNVGNEIQLLKLDMEDVLDVLNRRPKTFLQKLIGIE